MNDYTAATTHAALFDISSVGKLQLTGKDAPAFVHNISTNDAKSLPLGGGCELYFCDARAKALFVAWAFHFRTAEGANALWLETTPGRNAALLKYLDRFLIAEAVEMEDVTAKFAQWHLAGPKAKDLLESALAGLVPELNEFEHLERTFGATATCSIRRFDRLGVPGYDIACLPERAEGVRRMLEAAGAVVGTAQTYEVLRVEAGTPIYGIDIDENRFVMEVARAPRAVSYAKGCFPGQEPIVMARDRAGRINRSFLGLKVIDGGPVPAGSKLSRDGQDVGVITSSVDSPRLGSALALGYVHWKSIEPGTELIAETSDGPRPVTVIGYPPIPA